MPVGHFAAGLSRCCREVRTKTVTTMASRARDYALTAAGAESAAWWQKSYFLLFLALFFFVDFLAVFFLAAM